MNHRRPKAGVAALLVALIVTAAPLAACQRQSPGTEVPPPVETPAPEPAPEAPAPTDATTPPADNPESGAPAPPPVEGTQNPPRNESEPPPK